MEHKSAEIVQDEKSMSVEDTKSNRCIAKDSATSQGDYSRVNIDYQKNDEKAAQIASSDDKKSGDVNMEASIEADDVIRAGGFGARDDINSFLPGASDSTDFEASILDARNYEEPQENKCRHGLGWKESAEEK